MHRRDLEDNDMTGNPEGVIEGVESIRCTPEAVGPDDVMHNCQFTGGGEQIEVDIAEVFIQGNIDLNRTGKDINSDDYWWNFEEEVDCYHGDYPTGDAFRCVPSGNKP